MAREFTMPKLGLTMTDGTIREWLVAAGTVVRPGDPVLVIETDKVETEVEAREPGILHPTGLIGENYECGAVIGLLLSQGEPAPVAAATSPAAPEPQPASSTTAAGSAAQVAAATPTIPATPARPAPIAAMAEVASRGERGRILASPRARAAARNLGVELANIAGTGPLGRIVADDVIEFAAKRPAPQAESNGSDLIEQAAAASPAASKPAPTAAPGVAVAASSGPMVSATGGARVLAELLGIDLTRVAPAQAGARITREDVASWVRRRIATDAPAQPEARAVAPLLQTPTKVVPFRGVRGVIAQRMHASLREMAQLTLSVDADLTAINSERDRQRDAGETPPGYTAWVVSAAARALAEHPVINSQVTADGVALLPDINVGVAVALDDGLIVPVIEHANRRSVSETHGLVADLAGRARSHKLKLNELEGGTFSVTALGMYGVDMFTPVINPPNTAILGVGRLRTDTVWVEGRPEPRTAMTLSLTWDHRAFDGAPAAEFAQTIVRCLENPDLIIG